MAHCIDSLKYPLYDTNGVPALLAQLDRQSHRLLPFDGAPLRNVRPADFRQPADTSRCQTRMCLPRK